jgi:L-fucose isomerase-like protein
VQFGISPCLVTSDLMDHHVPAACEVDTGSAIAMHMLGLASGNPTTILDWNNNYGEDDDKCILFHCGNVPPSLMTAKGRITDHEILKNTVGEGRGFGCNSGRIAAGPFTFSNLLTEEGRIRAYVGSGRFTEDSIPREFFGCAGVAQVDRLQDVLLYLGQAGHRHHVTATPGLVEEAIIEALGTYLGFDLDVPQRPARRLGS